MGAVSVNTAGTGASGVRPTRSAVSENVASHATSNGFSSPTAKAQLKPKEHGAYAILAIPIGATLAATGFTLVSACIATAAIAGFLAHEPLLVALGHRGARVQRSHPTALRRLASLLAITLIAGMTALVLGETPVRLALVTCVLLAVISFSIAVAGHHRTLPGQLLGVVGLSVPCLPMLLAGRVDLSISIEAWATWLVGFSSTTIAVRSVIAAQKRRPRQFHLIALTILTLMVLLASFIGRFELPIVTAPMLMMSWYLLCSPPPAKYLKQVGWTLVLGTVATGVWMVVAL